MADLPKISDEMVELLARRLHRERYPDGERLDAHAAMAWDGYPGDEREPYRRRARAHLAALVASGWRPEALTIVDVAEQAREMFGEAADYIAGRRLPEHDYRFEATTATGCHVTFHTDATAGHVATYLKERERATALEQAQPLLADGLEVESLEAEHRCVTVVEEGPPEFFIDDHDRAVIDLYEGVESLELVEPSEGQERSEEQEHG